MEQGEYGIIGCGSWGLRLLALLREVGGLDFIGEVADLSPERLELASALEAEFGRHQEAASLLDRPGLRGVLIATPTPSHGDLVEAALERGLDVYVEKVASMDPAQCARIQSLVEREGRTLQLGLPWHHGPVAEALRGVLDDERLGRVHEIESKRTGVTPLRRSEGVIWDLLPHDLAMALTVAEMAPESVRVRELVEEGPEGLLVAASVDLAFESGMRASHRVSWIDQPAARSWSLTGERQEARVEELSRRRTLHLGGRLIAEDSDEPLQVALLRFLSRPPKAPGSCPVWVTDLSRTLEAVSGAARTPECWYPLPPVGKRESDAAA